MPDLYPRLVLNTRDGGVMTLSTGYGGHKPLEFEEQPGKGGRYVAYIDTTETTWREFLPFYARTRRTGGPGAGSRG